MKKLNLLQLKYFFESAQTENFSKTAEKFMIPTSTVSAAIKRLEAEIGTPLFEREANKIRLNPSGKILADALGRAFYDVENAICEITAGMSEKPEIKLLVRAKRTWITELIIEYKTTHPKVSFRMTHDFDTTDFDNFDIVVDEFSDAYSALDHFVLRAEPLCIKASRSSPLANKKLTIKQIENEPFVMMGKASAMRRLLERLGKKHGFTPNIAMEFDDRQCLLRGVELEMGLAIGSKSALAEESEERLVQLDVADFNESQIVCVYHRHISPKDIHLADFLKFLNDRAKDF